MNAEKQHRFEDRLLTELDLVVAEQPMPTPAQRQKGFGWRPRVVLSASALALGAAAVAVPAATVDTGEPAFAVTKKDDGSLMVTINEFRDPEGLEQRLAEEGITADVSYLENGRKCREPRLTNARQAILRDGPAGEASYVIDADDRGQTLVMEFSQVKSGGRVDATRTSAKYADDVQPCQPVPDPMLHGDRGVVPLPAEPS